MNRNKALIELAPGQQLRMSEGRLGDFFCGETFAFVLNPRTRRAAERVARWHGCEFRFYPATGCSAFVKRGRVSGTLVSLFESTIQWFEHMKSQARLYAASIRRGSPVHTGIAAAR
jgi:hypothetical protein